MDYIERAREIIDTEIQGLQKVRESLGPDFTKAVSLMLKCLANGKKIVVTGIGKNLHIAWKISSTLVSTGSTSVTLNPVQAMHGDLGLLSKGDVMLTLSYSGASDELLAILPLAKRIGVRIVGMTGDSDSDLAKFSDAVILVTVDREACPFNMAPTASTTATLAAGDALAMVLLEARGFQIEDYAKFHPGGAIGRSLLLRVSDIMRTAPRMAAVNENATVKDAVVAMTQARAGACGIVDLENRVKGIFTDGDLRRQVSLQSDVLARPIRELMTASPITVQASQLAAEALQVFEEHNIDDVLVVDGAGRLVGAVDIQDLPKLKIM
jgi:arabinose-5-phosphate isomerase